MELYEIGPLFRAYIEKRPSQHCRSPYVADINILCLDEPFIAHAPALGCCGYADKGKYVYVSIHEKPKLCTHVIHLAHIEEKNTSYLIGMQDHLIIQVEVKLVTLSTHYFNMLVWRLESRNL